MKRFTFVSLSFVVTFCASLNAEEKKKDESAAMFAPAAELKKFTSLAGDWKHAGTHLNPDGTVGTWTGKSTVNWIFNGHILQEELRVDLDNGVALIFRGFLGWNRERKEYYGLRVTNFGGVDRARLHWLDDTTLVALRTSSRAGVPTVERSVTRFHGDALSFEIREAKGAGGFVLMVRGKSEKSDAGYALKPEDTTAALMPAPEAMNRITAICGKYIVKGHVTPIPGVDPVRIAGNEAVVSMFGGAVVSHHVVGDPPPNQPVYEGWGFTTWNAEKSHYTQYWVDNMGGVHDYAIHNAGDHELVGIAAGPQYGMPGAERMVLRLREDGSVKGVTSDRFVATADPIRTFEGQYERVAK